ncbi:MAG: 2-oxoacid:ferredoxin oxidoreductase subunit gamma, partial [Firmicutes bacterium]|nr:2-oxoacid:ferredoxin oxidoreductase subunit gamma [Bacillota bacterium]
MARTELLLSGSGGQGLILAGIILAEAAAVYDDTNA